MLRRIRSEQLQVGMFIARLGGPWINHPFWRARFLLASEDQVRQIQSAGVQEVWIDILKGRNVQAPGTPEGPEAAGAIPMLPPIEADTAPPPAATLEAEIVRARELVQSGKAVIGSMFTDIRMGHALKVNGALLLVDSASRSLSRHGQALLALARLKARGDDNYLHAFAVCALMIAVGRTLNLPDDEVRELGLAGLVHDIGKLMLPEAIVRRASERTPEEEEIYRRHPSAGYRILNEARLYSNIPLDVCVHHHERVDGRGFPYGLVGRELSVHARIAAICDAYDSLTSSRPGHEPWSPARAMEYMAVRVDTLFDRRVFKAFSRTVGIYPLGTVLRLRSNRLAVVCAQNDADPLRPKVMAFYSVSQSRTVPTELIDLRHSDETVVAFENAADWGYTDEQLMEMYATAA